MPLTFIPDGLYWRRSGGWVGSNHLQLVELVLKLKETLLEVQAQIDTDSAEGLLKAEIGRRMGNLNSRANAAGMQSDMWNNQNNRFYKERVAIEQFRDAELAR